MRIALSLAALTVAAANAAGASGHLMPMRTALSGADRLMQQSNAASNHLNYYGGPILANVKPIAVFWGSNVRATTVQGIGGFYQAVVVSPLYDWLSEYNTAGVTPTGGGTGTNQQLGHGTYGGTFTITPSTTATTLDDSVIQAELVKQIKAGHLPAPDSNSLYMFYFPLGITITNSGSSSCTQFCAYHGTVAKATSGTADNLRYGVMPDIGAGSACAVGCGTAANSFDNLCSVSSHELVEATTDADVGLAQAYGPPLAWYDPATNAGEIGDICNGQQGTIVAGNGTTYTIQKEWSNASGACISTSSDAFTMTVSPSSQNLSAGSSVQFQIATHTVRGATQTISLSASGLPSGVTGSFQPSSVTAGGSSTLTVSATSSATNGAATFTISGAGSSSSQSASATVTVSGGSGGSGGCPSGTVDVGGVCVPGGCSSTGSGSAWAIGLVLGLFALALRRKA